MRTMGHRKADPTTFSSSASVLADGAKDRFDPPWGPSLSRACARK